MNKYEVAIDTLCNHIPAYDEEYLEMEKLSELLFRYFDKNKWHKYPDDKPKEDGDYLTAYFYKDKYYVTMSEWDSEYGFDIIGLIAWRELPEYEEE